MSRVYGICNKCKASNVDELKKLILELDPNATFDVKCQSNCGPGMHEPFVKYDNKFYMGDDSLEVIEQLEEDLEEE